MRRTSVLFLCSTLAPAGACLVGCFGSSSGGGGESGDGGFTINQDGSAITLDGGFDVSTFEGGPDGSPGGVISDTPVDFKQVSCGTTPGNMTYQIQNTGPVPVTFSATISSGPFTIVSIADMPASTPPSPLAPGATVTITLGANAIPATATPGVAITGTLTVTTDVPGFTNVVVPLTVTPQGGSLVLTPASPNAVGFGQQQVNTTSSPLPFTLSNVGNAPVSVAFGAPTDPEFAITGGGSIANGTNLAPASATFTPTSAGLKMGTSAITVTGAVCSPSPTILDLTGTGTVAAVNIGPSPLNFNTVSCGTSAPSQTVTISNTGTTAFTFTAALALGDANSPFVITPESGSVPANGQAIITVTPKPIPVPGSIVAGAYDDKLTITTTAQGSSPFTIPLNESAQGAILAVTMANSNFGTVQNQTALLPFTITNTGNLDATVAVSATPAGAGFTAVLTQGNVAKAGGGTAPGNVDFTPAVNGPEAGNLVVTTTTAVCGATVQPVGLTAVGAVPVIVATPDPVSLVSTCGTVCGAAPPPGAPPPNGADPAAPAGPSGSCMGTLTIQNTGNATASLAFTPGSAGIYHLVPPVPTSVPGGGSATVTIWGDIPLGPTGGTTPSDVLGFTTNEPFNPNHEVTVTNAVHGANIIVAQPATATCVVTPSFVVSNSGDMPATVFGPGTGCHPYYFLSDPFSTFGSTLPPFSISGTTITGTVSAFQLYASGCAGGSANSSPDVYPLTTAPTDNVCIQGEIDILYDSTDNATCSGHCGCG